MEGFSVLFKTIFANKFAAAANYEKLVFFFLPIAE
jgi:hypothetical protein